MESLDRARQRCTDALRLWNPDAVWLNSLLLAAAAVIAVAAAVNLAYYDGAKDAVFKDGRHEVVDLGIGATAFNVLAIVISVGLIVIGSMGLYNTLCKDVP